MTTTDRPDRDDLAAQVARIRPGDTVSVLVQHPDDDEPVQLGPGTARRFVSGLGLRVGTAAIRFPGGRPYDELVAVLSHEPGPATVADLDACGTYGVVEDEDGGLWMRTKDGRWGYVSPFAPRGSERLAAEGVRIVHRTEVGHD